MTLQYADYRTGDPVRPGVLGWFTVYVVLMALLYVVVVVLGIVLLVAAPTGGGRDGTEFMINGVVCVAVGLPLAVAFGIAPFLRPRPWVWIYDIVLICIGLTSCCTLPACIPLLIYWLKPETKLWFGRDA